MLCIPHICHGRHGRRPCKFFLAGVNFYRFNAKNWHFQQILRKKVAFVFTDLTRKIGVFWCKFYSPKILPVSKKWQIYGMGGIRRWNQVHWVLSDQSKKRRTFEVAGCAKKSAVARGSSQDFLAMSFIAVFSHKRGRCIWPERPFLISVA